MAFMKKENLEDDLLCKNEFGSVSSLNEKPAVKTAGFPTSDSDSYNDSVVPLIIHESPDLHNKKGDVMQNSGFPTFLLALSNYEPWINALPKHIVIFTHILARLASSETTHNVGKEKRVVLSGQAYLSLIQIQRYCGPQYSKNDVEGAKNYFIRENVNLLRQLNKPKGRQEKMLLSIRDTVCWDMINALRQTKKINRAQTMNQTKVRQKSDTKEIDRLDYLDKESLLSKSNARADSNSKIPDPRQKIEDFSSKLANEQNSELIEICELHENIPGVRISQEMLDECIEIVGTHEAVVEAITSIQRNPDRKFNLTNWPKQLRVWDTQPKKKSIKTKREENRKIAQKIIELYSGGNTWDLEISKEPIKGDEGILFQCKGGAQTEPKFISFSSGKFLDLCKEFIKKKQISIPK